MLAKDFLAVLKANGLEAHIDNDRLVVCRRNQTCVRILGIDEEKELNSGRMKDILSTLYLVADRNTVTQMHDDITK